MDWTRITEGDAITGNSLADRLWPIQNRINDLPAMSVAKNSMTRDHLPSNIIDVAHAIPLNPAADHQYDDNSDAYSGWMADASLWRVVNTNGSLGTGDRLEATFNNVVSIDMTDPTTKILVLANVECTKIYEDAVGVIGIQFYAVFTIQAQDAGGLWHVIRRSLRYINSEIWTNNAGTQYQLFPWKDVPLRTLLTSEDSDVAVSNLQTVKRIRVAVTVCDCSAAHAAQLVKVFLRRGNLTAIAYRAGSF